MKRILLVAITFLSLGLTGQVDSNDHWLLGVQWEVVSIRNAEGEMMELYEPLPAPFLLFTADSRVFGHDPDSECKYFDISYILTDDGITIYRDLNFYGADCDGRSPLIWALRSCSSYTLNESKLEFYDAVGQLQLVLQKPVSHD